MKNQIVCALALSAVILTPLGRLSVTAAEEGFKSIFNGKDLTGWDGNKQFWSVKDGAIVGQTTAENPTKGNTFLVWTGGDVSDFEMRFSYRFAPNNDRANSGVQYRSKVTNQQTWIVGGYQADFEAGPNYSGILYDEGGVAGGRGIMAGRGEKVVWDKDCKKQVVGSLGKSEDIQATIKKDGWNDYVIIARGNHFQHFINGKQTVDVIDECEAKRVGSGVVALQVHAGPPMKVEFKDLRLKTLSAESAAADLEKLQGIWEIAGAELNGSAVASYDLPSLVVTITGKSYSVNRDGETDRGEFTIDSAKQPKQMDIRPKTGSDEGRTLLAIYAVDGDSFRVCYAAPGFGRPTAFATEQDSERLVVNYKRKKQ
jgi:uncharacterized protein (TIGR03067 family)